MCSQRVKLASRSAGKSAVGTEMIIGARKRRADRSGSSGMANSERIHLDVLRATRKSALCPRRIVVEESVIGDYPR
jgi:hypothetical protein